MRTSQQQRQRTQNDPLVLGSFSQLSLRNLRGTLGPKNQVVGRADTRSTSNGGFGGGAYNHWFQINLLSPAWIIVTKSGPRPKYINVSTYDLNLAPIEGRSIFDDDSVTETLDGEVFHPYVGHMMSKQSNLYNHFVASRLDKGDERYYPLNSGSYLLCVSTTRNEPLDYEVGLVVEFPTTEVLIQLEDESDDFLLLQETAIDSARTIVIESPISSSTTISTDPNRPNGFTELLASINSGVTVTIADESTWLIGEQIPSGDGDGYAVIAEVGNDEYYDTVHDHSLSEWRTAWNSQHQDTDRFPDYFIPLTDRV